MPTATAPRYSFSTLFPKIELGPKDPILGIQEAFVADPNPQKVSLGVGAYRDDDGKPWILPSVRKAETKLIASPDYNHEYFPIIGSAKLCKEAKKLAYGDDAALDNMVALQSLSGTGSLRVLFGFIKEQWTKASPYSELPMLYFPNQTWGNHRMIAAHAGLKWESYPYHDPKTNGLDFQNLMTFLKNVPQNSVVLFHAVAHNPTGCDPTQEQWKEIAEVVAKREVAVLFDSAYQGFASGDFARDAFSCRYFRNEGKIKNIMLAQSFAKNMGLYGQRVGVVSVDCNSKDEYEKVMSQVKMIARAMYSNPSTHGGKIAELLLTDAELRKEWIESDIVTMSNRIITMREALRSALENTLKSSRSWKHITDQIGMFCFTGLNEQQCDQLMSEHSIYLTRNGRISIAGLNTKNVNRVAEAINAVTK
eukprot:CAMPEP_0202686148 /NCGR_PEP_ID=MMETSP1385-20130828/1952_1 /ASSEMBLY_ACC=CAM_ASM_000861 /TAXON_ID=933848 /ORGANISM="Elphidium margaritaceum" /LENGTH=420 /DNA_ID=CAMNT_0049340669 /DNA_START=109 /DNA_END=1372 /DNA_ORIENTATION=+